MHPPGPQAHLSQSCHSVGRSRPHLSQATHPQPGAPGQEGPQRTTRPSGLSPVPSTGEAGGRDVQDSEDSRWTSLAGAAAHGWPADRETAGVLGKGLGAVPSRPGCLVFLEQPSAVWRGGRQRGSGSDWGAGTATGLRGAVPWGRGHVDWRGWSRRCGQGLGGGPGTGPEKGKVPRSVEAAGTPPGGLPPPALLWLQAPLRRPLQGCQTPTQMSAQLAATALRAGLPGTGKRPEQAE